MKLRVLVVDEEGEVVMHGPLSSYDLRQDYDRIYYSTGPDVWLPRPAHVEIVCSQVTSGPPAPAKVIGGGRPHNFDPITDLVRTCKDCGYRETIVAALMGHSAPPCPGPTKHLASSVFTPTKGNHTWTVLKSRDPGSGPVIKVAGPGTCECGSAKAGLPTHSSWCPAAKP